MKNREFIAKDLLSGDFTVDEVKKVNRALKQQKHQEWLDYDFIGYYCVDQFYKVVLG